MNWNFILCMLPLVHSRYYKYYTDMILCKCLRDTLVFVSVSFPPYFFYFSNLLRPWLVCVCVCVRVRSGIHVHTYKISLAMIHGPVKSSHVEHSGAHQLFFRLMMWYVPDVKWTRSQMSSILSSHRSNEL